MKKRKLMKNNFKTFGSLSNYLFIFLLLGMLMINAQFVNAQRVQAQQVQGKEEEAYKIQWRDYMFYTNRPLPPMPKALTIVTYPEAVKGFYFVQFTGHITKQMKKQVISAGGEIFVYVPNNTYIVKMSEEVRAKIETLPIVQWVGVYQPSMRLSLRLMKKIEGVELERPKPPRIFKFEKPETESAGPKPLQLTILVFKGEDLERISKAIEEAGGKVLVAKKGKRRSKLRVTCLAEKTYDLARIDGVMWIEEFLLHELHNNSARGVMDITPVWNNHGLTGNGQIVGISDSGLDSGVDDATMHDDIEDRIDNILSWPVQAGYGAINANADDGASDLNSGHGTHTTGSALGDGTMSGGAFSGVAPNATFVFQALEQFTDWPAWPGNPPDGFYLTGIPIDLNDLFLQSYNEGVRIHSNSWGHPADGAYDDSAEDVDEFVWNHPDMLILFSAGNDGEDADQNNIVDPDSMGSPGTAKNCITVGASENDRPAIVVTYDLSQSGLPYGPIIDADRKANNSSGMAAFSGRGPTDDGRFKPDVTAPGTVVASMRSQSVPYIAYFADDMESGPGAWTVGGNWGQITADACSPSTSWHDSPGGNYADNADSSLTSPTLNITAGAADKYIIFWCRYDLGTGDDWLLEVSSDGGANWPGSINLSATIGTQQADWRIIAVGLGGFSNSANFRVRFRLISDNDGNTGDGLFVDNVRIVEGPDRSVGWTMLSDFGLAALGSADEQNYLLMDGTSMSTPLTAGAVALIRQYYMDVVGLHYVSAALLRATLINGAVEMSPGQYGTGANQEISAKPNNVEGWGRVNLENSLFPSPPLVLDHVDELAGLENGDSRTYSLGITDDTVPITITMVYHDYPGVGLQNDLDMTVTPPGDGVTIYPNNRTSAQGPDPNNNVEQIVIPTSDVQLGTYTITINGTNVQSDVLYDEPQPYALVITAGGTIVERDPVDVMLVLDLSGSMLFPACSGCNPKLDVLKDAVELFVQLWTAVAVPNDRIGVTYFRTNINEFDVGGNVLLPVLANAGAIITDVQSQNTVSSNLTAMGGGLQSAINRLVDEIQPSNIVLFTNGMQNVNPMVLGDATTGLKIDNEPGRPNSGINPEVPPTELDMNLGIKINTIGVGATDPFRERLDNIASETGGLSKLTTAPDNDLRRFFVEELIDVLRESSPQLLVYRYGSLETKVATETFTTNNSARKITLKLSWKRGNKLSFRVEKDGFDLTRYGQVINGPFYSIFTMDIPAEIEGNSISAGGEWQMRISGTKDAAYEATAIVEESLLEYDFSIGRKDYVVGDPLELSVKLSFGGQSVTDAWRVTATVLKPQQGLGTLLSINPSPAEPPGFEPESTATAGQRKLQLLLRDESFYRDLQPIKKSLILQNNGDGSYSTVFTDTDKTGTYSVIFQVEGERSDIGKYVRSEILSTMVRFEKAEYAASDLRVKLIEKTADGRRIVLSIRPKDRFGNYLGPDYGDRIKVELSAGSVGVEKQDLADGSYTIPLFVPPSTNPVLTVSVMDQPVYEGPLSKIEDHFSISIHSGIAIPTGVFANDFNPGFNVLLNLDYHFTPQLSLVGLFGYNNFRSKTSGVDNTHWINLSANLKYRLLDNMVSPYINGGLGYYIPKAGDNGLGANLGFGLNYDFSSSITFEIGADYHAIFGEDVQFLHSHAGIILRF
ncbi:MAG: S8 family serine peptidase [Candidatus Hodarchaeota archaeon]